MTLSCQDVRTFWKLYFQNGCYCSAFTMLCDALLVLQCEYPAMERESFSVEAVSDT